MKALYLFGGNHLCGSRWRFCFISVRDVKNREFSHVLLCCKARTESSDHGRA